MAGYNARIDGRGFAKSGALLFRPIRVSALEEIKVSDRRYPPSLEPHDFRGDLAQLRGGVTYIDHGHIRIVAQADEVRKDFTLVSGVERGQRLVEQQEPRAHEQRAANSDALALATG
jgi:hypothetical protein